MHTATLVCRNLAYFWRTNIAVVLGVATAVSVLAGALVVGDSVRASLRDLVLNRLGKTDTVISAANFFRENLTTSGHLVKRSPRASSSFSKAWSRMRRVAGVHRRCRFTGSTSVSGDSTVWQRPNCRP